MKICTVTQNVLCVTVLQGGEGWSVTYTSTQICAIKGSTVDMKCTYTYPAKIQNLNNTVQRRWWFTKEHNNVQVDVKTDPDYTGRVEYYCDENTCTLRISNLTQRDSANYKFRFLTNHAGGKFTGLPGVTLTVSGKTFIILLKFSHFVSAHLSSLKHFLCF